LRRRDPRVIDMDQRAHIRRNFDEVLRVIDSLQLTANHSVATPANWQPGDNVIISGAVSDQQARELFGRWESPRPYIRIVPQPQDGELVTS
jgi:thioredoxin-dependent peroxiredoxin